MTTALEPDSQFATSIRSRGAQAGRATSRLFGRGPGGRLASSIASIGAILAIWQLLASAVIQDSLMLPTVVEVAERGWELWQDGSLQSDILISLQRTLLGFSLAVFLGVSIGLVMGSVRLVEQFVSPILSLTFPIPKIGLVPLFMLWFGIGELSKVAVIAAAAIYPIIVSVYTGVEGINKRLIWRAKTLGASRIQTFFRVIIPGALPPTFVGLRLAMAISWIVLFAAEMVAASDGLGYLILHSQQVFDSSAVFVSLAAIAVLGYLFDRLVLLASRTLCGWHHAEGSAQAGGL